MLSDRKYQIPADSIQLTESQFQINNQQHTTIIGIHDLQKLPVFVILHKESDKSHLLARIEEVTHTEIETENDLMKIEDKRIIVICDGTKFGKLEKSFIGHPLVEIFDVRHMFINPTKHIYQPKWRLMSDDEITQMLQRYEARTAQTSRTLLGSICIDDPINRYYGGRPQSRDKKGDVFEILRDGINIFYRKVISKKMNGKGERK
jgi:DNA-directed RNA polymerase subunit H (RpoH/RPB5)